MEGNGLDGTNRKNSDSEKAGEQDSCGPVPEAGGTQCSSLMGREECDMEEDSLMNHVIGAACVLSGCERVEENEESKFDIYIVNERGKVNGYELKHIGLVEGSGGMVGNTSMNGSLDPNILQVGRRNKGIPPQEFYSRKKSNISPLKSCGNKGLMNKEKCNPIILEISEISSMCGMAPSMSGNEESGEMAECSCPEQCPCRNLSESEESSRAGMVCGHDIEAGPGGVDSISDSRRDGLDIALVNTIVGVELGTAGECVTQGDMANKEFYIPVDEAVGQEGSDGACHVDEGGDEREKEAEAMKNVIKAIEMQTSNGSAIGHKIGLNNAYKYCSNGDKEPKVYNIVESTKSTDFGEFNTKSTAATRSSSSSASTIGADEVSEELKAALLAAFVPSAMQQDGIGAGTPMHADPSFVEKNITRRLRGEPNEVVVEVVHPGILQGGPPIIDSSMAMENQEVLDLPRDSPLIFTARHPVDRGRSAEDPGTIVFVEAEDLDKEQSDSFTGRHTRNNRVGKLVKFFESFQRDSEKG